MIEDYRLRTFLEVARQGNFTRAAEVLSLTQPAVTLQIKSLEQELGCALFDRSGQKIVLSQSGQMLLPHAEAVHRIAEQAREELAGLGQEHSGQLRIGASTTIAQYVVPELVARFAQKHRKVHFHLISGNTEHIADKLESGEIDLGLVEGPVTRKRIKVEDYRLDELVLIVSGDSNWQELASQAWSLEQIKLAPLIMRESGSGTRSVIEKAFKGGGLKTSDLNILLEMDSTEAIKSAVAAGLGVAIVSLSAISKELQLGLLKTVPLEIPIRRDFTFVTDRDKPTASMVQAFKRFARAN